MCIVIGTYMVKTTMIHIIFLTYHFCHFVHSYIIQNHEKCFQLMITSCPPGHVLHDTNVPDEYKCKCNIENDQKIISCMQNESKVILKVCMYIHMYILN